VKRVSDAERTIRESSPDDDVDAISNVFRRIEQDCSGVFPDLKIFQPGGPMYDDLVRVTKAYAFYRSGFAYFPGSHAVAATFLVNLSPFNAFVALANSLNRFLPLAFLSGDQMTVYPLPIVFNATDSRNTNITLNSMICFTIISTLCMVISLINFVFIPRRISTECFDLCLRCICRWNCYLEYGTFMHLKGI